MYKHEILHYENNYYSNANRTVCFSGSLTKTQSIYTRLTGSSDPMREAPWAKKQQLYTIKKYYRSP